MSVRRMWGAVLACIMLLVTVPAAQTTPGTGGTPPPRFEVASVKRNTSGDLMIGTGAVIGGRFVATNARVRDLVRYAYRLEPFQVDGGPAWIDEDRFDVNATMPPAASAAAAETDRAAAMLTTLLAERFTLAAHKTQREMPTYALVVANAAVAARLQPPAADCAAVRRRQVETGQFDSATCTMFSGIGSIESGGATLAQLAALLSRRLGRVVRDETGLPGDRVFTLTFAPPEGLPPGPLPPGVPPIDPNAPSLFAAVQEQLGLQLKATRALVDVLVIDRVERPDPD